jgi:RNA polymerase sigma-70 factor (ECF subfamily)
MGADGRTLPLEDERALVDRLRAGDTAALEALWRAHAEVVYAAVIYPRVPVRDLAEEVLQNTFLKAYERIGQYKWHEQGILPWLKTIARNLAMDVHRTNQRADKFCQGYGHFLEAADEGSIFGQRPDKALFEADWHAELVRRVGIVLESDKFNERYTAAIELRIFAEHSREECAERLGVKVGTFDVLFHRAIKRFETVYKDLFGEPDS